jgi:hypothetical protein
MDEENKDSESKSKERNWEKDWDEEKSSATDKMDEETGDTKD